MYKRGRYPFWVLLCGMMALTLLMAACGDDNKSNAPDAHALIQKAQQAIQKVKSYHFTLETENPGQNPGGMTLKSADGDIQVPDKLKASAGVVYSGIGVNTDIVALGEKQYYKDPISGQWQETSDLIDPRVITSSETGISALLGGLQDPSTPQDSTVNGTPCWSIDGKLDTKYIGSITGLSSGGGKTVDATVCLGKSDNLPYQIVIKGKAVEGDKDDTKRTFTLSKFDEPLDIQAPK